MPTISDFMLKELKQVRDNLLRISTTVENDAKIYAAKNSPDDQYRCENAYMRGALGAAVECAQSRLSVIIECIKEDTR